MESLATVNCTKELFLIALLSGSHAHTQRLWTQQHFSAHHLLPVLLAHLAAVAMPFRCNRLRAFFGDSVFSLHAVIHSACARVFVRVSACLGMIFVSVAPLTTRFVRLKSYMEIKWKGCCSDRIHNHPRFLFCIPYSILVQSM